MVNIFFEETEILDLDPEFFASWLTKVCVIEKNSLEEISLVFCSDEYLLKMNVEYLDHDYYTDIITFDNSNNGVAGDFFISIDRVTDNAKQHKVKFREELNRVVVHGLLHLLGYNDKSEVDKTIMTSKEDEYLNLIVSRET